MYIQDPVDCRKEIVEQGSQCNQISFHHTYGLLIALEMLAGPSAKASAKASLQCMTFEVWKIPVSIQSCTEICKDISAQTSGPTEKTARLAHRFFLWGMRIDVST